MTVTKLAKPIVQRNTDAGAAEFRAVLRYARGSAQKARLVMDKVRGLMVSDALDQLNYTHRRAARQIDKLLKSAIANADKAIEDELVRDDMGEVLDPQPNVDVDDLYVHEAFVDEGPGMRRWRPRSRGSANQFHKYYCHMTIKLRPVQGGKD